MNKYGTNVNKLIIQFISINAIPPGGGIAAGLEFFKNPERRKEVLEKAESQALAAIALIKTAPDNPYGNNDEAIAQGILDKIIERKLKNENKK